MNSADAIADAPVPSGRARPLGVEERQAMIIDAVLPLLLEYGPAVTSRQLADAAGVAEGTIFRAFGDKESLLRAAVEKYMDPAPLRRALSTIPLTLSLEDKVLQAVSLMQARFGEVFGVMARFDEYHRRPHRHAREEFVQIFRELLEPDRPRLRCDPEQVAHVIRLLTFSSSLPQLNDGVTYSAKHLTDIILHGVASTDPDRETEE